MHTPHEYHIIACPASVQGPAQRGITQSAPLRMLIGSSGTHPSPSPHERRPMGPQCHAVCIHKATRASRGQVSFLLSFPSPWTSSTSLSLILLIIMAIVSLQRALLLAGAVLPFAHQGLAQTILTEEGQVIGTLLQADGLKGNHADSSTQPPMRSRSPRPPRWSRPSPPCSS